MLWAAAGLSRFGFYAIYRADESVVILEFDLALAALMVGVGLRLWSGKARGR